MDKQAIMNKLNAGEWVETDKVCKTLGITFEEGMERFAFLRTANWWSLCGKTPEERARNGQKIETYFKKKENELL